MTWGEFPGSGANSVIGLLRVPGGATTRTRTGPRCGVRVGCRGVAQGQVDRGEARLDLDQGRGVGLDLAPGTLRGPDAGHVLALLSGNGLIAPRDRGLGYFAQQAAQVKTPQIRQAGLAAEYDNRMKRITVSLPDELAEKIKRAAGGERKVSSYVATALEDYQEREILAEILAAWGAETPVPEDVRRQAEAELDEAGLTDQTQQGGGLTG